MTKIVILTSAAIAVLLAGCSSSGAGHVTASRSSTSPSQTPATVDVSASVVLGGQYSERDADPAGSPCYASGNSPFPSPTPYDDVKAGAQVVIAGANGTTLGVAVLDDGATLTAVAGSALGHPDCSFHFAATGVKPGEAFYKITVGSHSKQIEGSQLQTQFAVPIP